MDLNFIKLNHNKYHWIQVGIQSKEECTAQKKVRLVTQGFLQVPGFNYFDNYAPVACLTSIWMVLSLAAHEDMEIHQINIKGAYLNGEVKVKSYICGSLLDMHLRTTP